MLCGFGIEMGIFWILICSCNIQNTFNLRGIKTPINRFFPIRGWEIVDIIEIYVSFQYIDKKILSCHAKKQIFSYKWKLVPNVVAIRDSELSEIE